MVNFPGICVSVSHQFWLDTPTGPKMSSTRRVPVKVIQLLLYVSGCRHLMLTADSPSFPPALSHLQLHLHTEYFTFNQVSVP